MNAIGWVLLVLVSYQGTVTVREHIERHVCWKRARCAADTSRKPLLVVGLQRFFWDPPNGDATIDIDPAVASIVGGVVADERNIPFPDSYFGACYNAHTLEHLASAADVQKAVNECTRVADVTYFLGPSPYSIIGNFFCPAHNLRLWFDPAQNRIVVAENRYWTGLGYNMGNIGQYMTTRATPVVIDRGYNSMRRT